MNHKINNFVFEGGGVLGIAYLGVLDYLCQKGMYSSIKNVAGTSAGAITACVSSFNLPFQDMKRIADSLDYRKIPEVGDVPELKYLPPALKREMNKIVGNIDCVYRLLNRYGWYSSNYFYQWLQQTIADQFDSTKKAPPYTFADFKNAAIHKDKRPFKDLYIMGTNLSYKISKLFSYETTPDVEVALAVRISMSIPLFFESISTTDSNITHDDVPNLFVDGGVMANYPIQLFDTGKSPNQQTVGAHFKSQIKYSKTNNLLDFIKNLNAAYMDIQQNAYNHSPQDISRTIDIDTGSISPVNFNVTPNDETYNFLYQQGIKASEQYFDSRKK
ncbi:patatin [Desulfuribacillus stibiiarsenatis]|uniref:Patatin n=1 Tax=Desulfuribacillus stibiiarsenatis TaxID=1390249 RepID=A0A1E5L231_9FIRM|nr:patatin-like phospholipase family protein [Desulfuribacillus stibiiarsenatis]OEH84166.1 patatin [Desulfuribacillus stibiiarsenatis]